jgi:hypothetical protein
VTFRELIDRRWKSIKIVVVPLLLAALVLIGNDPPWTTANCIGVAVFLVALIVIIACVGTVRCPLCQRFIGPGTALRFLKTPPLERCGHCGLRMDEKLGAR